MTPATVRFGEFEFDHEAGLLTRAGALVDLPPRPTAVLAVLVRNAGRLVPRSELIAEVWADQGFGAESGLNTCIKQIRAALDDPASRGQWIRTVHRRGYMFAAPAPPAAVPPAAGHRDRPGRSRILALAAVGAVAGGIALALYVGLPGAATEPSLSPDVVRRLGHAQLLASLDSRDSLVRAVSLLTGLQREVPRSTPVTEALIRAELRLANDSAAAALATTLLDFAPRSPWAWHALGTANLHRGRWSEAERDFQAAVRHGAGIAEIELGFARHLSARGRHEDAMARIDEVLQRGSVGPVELREAGWIALRAGRPIAARDYCGRSIARVEADADARRCRLHAALALGDTAQAADDAQFLLILRDRWHLGITTMPDRLVLSTYWDAVVQGGDSVTVEDRYEQGVAAAALGRADLAFAKLQPLAGTPSAVRVTMPRDPRLRSLHSDPRWGSLVRAATAEIE